MYEMVEDPVCHMQVISTSFATEYAGGHYAFCSAQCKERFLASPHLYVGFPGRKAPAQEGKEVIKRHRLLLSAPLDAIQAEQVKRALLPCAWPRRRRRWWRSADPPRNRNSPHRSP